ncbi:DUF2235 domain-containing protein [Ruegeria hyattellae]|uniref:DUF2235 domain-containing protein n=1 Tax=Ruegeria hyattellae TaxID=3233337 RepID=UPI00355C2D6D
MANLIVCCDGTWNTPDQEDDGRPSPTNVVKIHSALAKSDAAGVDQKKYYRPGVGTSGWKLKRWLDGGLGRGLSDDIKSAYKWLCETYAEGDEIYLFGFSRGAYAVRSLAGLIGGPGLLCLDEPGLSAEAKWQHVHDTYHAYRTSRSDASWSPKVDRHDDVSIRFLGVWDTVGALGVPDEMIANAIDRPDTFLFHDTTLGPIVRTARHAVATDERRRTFTPTLWTNLDETRDVEQKWFAGVHGDVGGSYFERGLGDLPLGWMIDEAEKAGLAFRPGVTQKLSPDPTGILHESVKGIFSRLRTRPRSVPKIVEGNDSLHSSALARHADPPLIQPDYWPTQTLKPNENATRWIAAREHWNRTGLFLEKGVDYEFKATGEWLDAKIHCTPDGPKPGFHPAKLFYIGSVVSDLLQRRKRERTGHDDAVVRGARREQNMPWFCLVGVVANGQGVDLDSHKINHHEAFRIGSARSYTPRASGYLYCFANDVWSFYGNNKGGISLSVARG